MASVVKEPPEMVTQKGATKPQPKPPLKPKPPVLAHRAVKQNGAHLASAILEPSTGPDGWQSGTEVRVNSPPAPAGRRTSDEAGAGDVLSSSGNVRKMRELFDKASGLLETEEAAAKEMQVRAPVQPEPALEVPEVTRPVPKARKRPLAKGAAVTDDSVSRGGGGQVPLVPRQAPADLHPSQETLQGLETETDMGLLAAGEIADVWQCPSGCPCMCHLKRPGMVLVWKSLLGGQDETDGSDHSGSDSSGNGPFRFVLRITDAEVKEEATSLETAAILGNGSNSGFSLHPESEAISKEDGPPLRPPARPNPVNAVPKPPRRNKPAAPAETARLPHRRLAVLKQRYTASDLDKISKCVGELNLHIQKRQLPPTGDQHFPVAEGTASHQPAPACGLPMPPSPKVTRSAPPSPKDKHQPVVYDEVYDVGLDDASRDDDYEVHLEIVESSPVKNGGQNTTNWESQFESEPLYQTYRETVIKKEIKRQTLMRDSSKTSDDYTYESIPLAPDSDSAPLHAPGLQPPGSSLWQNLNAVRESGILNELSQRECRLQESMFEVLTSEASYLRSLNVLIEHFMNSRDLNETIILRDKKTLFSCITRVKEVSESFLKDLEERMDENIKITDVCDIIYFHAQHNFQVYVDYVRNQLYQEQKYSQLMEESAQFAAVVVRLQEQPRCQRLPLMSFLLLPFQRITRIKMLIENILQRSEVGSVNEETASKALGLVSKIIEECNREVGIMKQMEEMIHIGKKLEFDKLKAIPIISQLRHLEKQGELWEIGSRGNLFAMKPKLTPLYLFLFNDLLLITTKKSGDRYQVMDHAHRSLVEVQDCPGAGLANCFRLVLLENHQGKQCDRLLKTSTDSDLHRWMDALTSGKQNLLEDSDDDKIYERWDCPQVQCLVTYTAQQGDELSLEPADIINVTRKSAEGWYEGCKLSTGQKGWFPSASVQEITNEHVRRRNLRERYRLMQAAQHQIQGANKVNTTSV
ncbi:LOW QUALITY PROTEIN: ephexin-1-like [Stegostoma tigrinum]|uniref:LOW QUALITY PROTEIN: ephexin-1-like n=1 Tax=Stegostoma tigrinum TaxID=3053191 RepID=UPI00286FCC71|nr:LOW QUALITY PROTEIN: ephexin-1-like [Stegostoma tigrinum]